MGLQPVQVQIAQLIVQVIGFGGALYGLFFAIQVQLTKMTTDYSEKYKGAVLALPHEYIIGDAEKSLYSYEDDMQKKILLSCVRLFSCLSEEYEIHKRHPHPFVSKEIWMLWIDGNRKNMRFKMLREAWEVLKFRYHAEFCMWMNSEIIAKRDQTSSGGWI
jgi:hypothetical protein